MASIETHLFRRGAKLLIPVLAGFILAACQPANSDSADTPRGGAGSRPPLAAHEFAQLQLPSLECSRPETCPAAVGELVTVRLQGQDFCTASLVAPDIVLTASHCVPWENLSPEHRFTGNCWMRFPASRERAKGEPREATAVPCAELISASRLGQDVGQKIYPDYAFIRLSRPQTGRALFAIHGTKDEKKDSALLYGVKPAARAHVIEFLHCRRDDGYRLDGVQTTPGESLIFPSCEVVHGFSGGPILSPLSREIIGVISGVVGFDPTKPDRTLPSVGTAVASLPNSRRSSADFHAAAR